MKLVDILKKINIKYEVISDNSSIDIKNISLNSNEITNNDIFVAIKGFKTDGHKFIKNSFEKGVRNFIIEDGEFITSDIKNNSSIIKVDDSRTAMALVSNLIFDYPYDKLKMIGITGTKGKTTTSTLIYNIFNSTYKTNLFSTVKNIVNDVSYDSVRTTMEANKLQEHLCEAVNKGTNYNVVEVSSHAVTLKRIYDINWDVAIFTNFSQDHLDLYQTMENYFEAKLDFFRNLNNSTKKNKIAIINLDDPKGIEVVKVLNNSVKVITVGKDQNTTYQIENSKADENGIEFDLKKGNFLYKVKSKLRGKFNIHNISLAFICGIELGIDYDTINQVISSISGIEGRFEIIIDKPFKVIIDYAHTPDSLEKILIECKNLSSDRLISIFGCTGDRDKEKRPIMGAISAKIADYTIITNDDTYTENPLEIAKSVETGLINENKKINIDYEIILDRKNAIKSALEIVKNGDVIIIAGMGHEKFQIIGNNSIPYSDKETVLELIKFNSNI